MLGDFKWLFIIALCSFDMVLLPLILLCLLNHPIAYVIPALPVLFFAIREERRQIKAKLNPCKFKAVSDKTIDEYVEMVRKKDKPATQ